MTEPGILDILVLLSRLLLAVVFAVAAIAKFYDPEGTKKAFQDFGFGKALIRVGAAGLPVVEIVTAFLLITPSTGWYGGLFSLLLLALFTIILASAVAQGKQAECHCFGQFSSKPVGWGSLVRNLLLLAPAGLIVYGAQPTTPFGLYLQLERLLAGGGFLFYVLIFSCLTLLGVIVYYQRRSITLQRELLANMPAGAGSGQESGHQHHEHMTSPEEGLPIGATVPDFALPDMQGKEVTFEQLLMRGRPLLFFFMSPTCAPCKALLPEIGKWQEELAGKVDFIFFSRGSVEENAAKLPRLGGQIHLLQSKREVAELFKAKWTPTAVLVNTDGLIASRLAPGDALIKDLIDAIKEKVDNLDYVENGRGMSPGELKIGDELPEFKLPDTKGENVTDKLIRGKKTLALFWGLDCPHCQRMLPEIKAWEKVPANGVQLVIFSSGDAEKNRALDMRSPVVLDDDGKVGSELGMFGTPSAVLIDEAGKIVSETAVGSEQIWSLVGKRKS
jgi:thiol-disulfide isomerase/thioredoxin/uncharacterized membrane protein YphA (DoxX/SURF4 family)